MDIKTVNALLHSMQAILGLLLLGYMVAYRLAPFDVFYTYLLASTGLSAYQAVKK